MDLMERSTRSRAIVVVGSFVLVLLIGYIDGRSSAYIAFSIFYMIPIFLASWFAGRWAGIAIAVSSALAGLAADFLSIGAAPAYAYTNVVLRLVLFVVMASVFARMAELMRREQAVAEREREAAERLEQLAVVRDALMRSVALDAREPLGDIYARIVTLGFDLPTLTTGETREVLSEIADASRRLSDLVDTLQADTVERPTDTSSATPVR